MDYKVTKAQNWSMNRLTRQPPLRPNLQQHQEQGCMSKLRRAGTTGIAALKLKRQFLGIEKCMKTFENAKRNIPKEEQ